MAWLAGPHLSLAEARSVDRRVHRVVLDRIDFTQKQRHFRIVAHCGSRAGCSISCPRHGSYRGGGDHQDSVQAHGTLDRGVRAGLNQVRARPKSCPSQCRRHAKRHFGGERLHARPLRGWCTYASHGRTRRVTGDGPSKWLGVGVVWSRRESTRRSETAAQLTNNHERSGYTSPRKRETVRETDRQPLPRGNRDHDGGPRGWHPSHRRHRRWVQWTAGRRSASRGSAAEVAPHRHRSAVRERCARRRGSQIDHLLAEGCGRRERKNADYS